MEIQELRNQLRSHPEVSRLQFENYQLREKFRKLENYATSFQEHSAKLARLEDYERELASHIIRLTRDSDHQDDSTDDNVVLVSKLRVMSEEKIALESKVSDLSFEAESLKRKVSELESSLNFAKFNQRLVELDEVRISTFILVANLKIF
jgi:uncharacterized protein YlxW (UPF0749 family)